VPCEGFEFLSLQVPQLHGVVILAVASVLPSGLKLTLLTRIAVPFEGFEFLSLQVPQLHGVVRTGTSERLAVGAETHTMTELLCPLRVLSSCPCRFHSFTVLSQLAVASVLPSGLKLTLLTELAVPFEGFEFLSLQVPQLHGVVRTGSSDRLAVGAETHTSDITAVPF
jgi:hypothetical protein